MAPYHQPDPVRLPQPAPGSATPTSTVHAFFRCTRWLSTFHRGARPVFTRPSKSEREHDLSSKALSFSKERMRKRERERERERKRERESVCVRASMTGESSRACFSWLRFIAERTAFTIFYRAGAKELENAIYSPQVFLLRKKDVQRSSMTGESSRKNLNILQASASKLSGFTPRIQPSACGLGLYSARCKTR